MAFRFYGPAGANLFVAFLSYADLTGASLAGATLLETHLTDTNLSGVKGQLRKDRKPDKGAHYKVWSLISLDLDGYLFNDDWNRGFKSELTKRSAADFVGWESDEE